MDGGAREGGVRDEDHETDEWAARWVTHGGENVDV